MGVANGCVVKWPHYYNCSFLLRHTCRHEMTHCVSRYGPFHPIKWPVMFYNQLWILLPVRQERPTLQINNIILKPEKIPSYLNSHISLIKCSTIITCPSIDLRKSYSKKGFFVVCVHAQWSQMVKANRVMKNDFL